MVTHSTRGISLVDIYSQLLGSSGNLKHTKTLCVILYAGQDINL